MGSIFLLWTHLEYLWHAEYSVFFFQQWSNFVSYKTILVSRHLKLNPHKPSSFRLTSSNNIFFLLHAQIPSSTQRCDILVSNKKTLSVSETASLPLTSTCWSQWGLMIWPHAITQQLQWHTSISTPTIYNNNVIRQPVTNYSNHTHYWFIRMPHAAVCLSSKVAASNFTCTTFIMIVKNIVTRHNTNSSFITKHFLPCN